MISLNNRVVLCCVMGLCAAIGVYMSAFYGMPNTLRASKLLKFLHSHNQNTEVENKMTEVTSSSVSSRPTLSVNMSPNNKIPANRSGYDITLVTMFLNLGKFQKGASMEYTPEKYFGWMNSWANLNNTVIAFFDDENVYNMFKKVRSAQPAERTIAYKIERNDLPDFKNLEKVRQIYAQPGYPKHHPNTVKAEYSCSVSAKADVIDIVLKKEKIKTKYLAWLDMGYFRLLSTPAHKDTFVMEVPDKFDDQTVAFSVINDGDALHSSPWDIIRHNMVWVASGLIVGTPQVMTQYVEDFRSARSELLSQNMSSTGQQVIAALYSGRLTRQPSVRASTYSCRDGQYGMHGSDLIYFCFGFKCKEAAEIRRKNKN